VRFFNGAVLERESLLAMTASNTTCVYTERFRELAAAANIATSCHRRPSPLNVNSPSDKAATHNGQALEVTG